MQKQYYKGVMAMKKKEIEYIYLTVEEFSIKYNIRLKNVNNIEIVCDTLSKYYLDVFYASYSIDDVREALEAEQEMLEQFNLMEYICIDGLYIVIC
jgi:hypothetical protein